MSATETSSEPRAREGGFDGRHSIILLTLLLTVGLNSLIGLLVANSQARIAIHFHTTEIAWTSLGGGLLSTFVLPFAMKAAAVWGRRRVMITLTAIGLLGDVIAALATNYPMLVAGRTVAGFYACAPAIAYAAARDVFPGRLVKTASGLLAASVGLVGIGGPFLSGWLIDTWSFRGAFWFMAIVVALCLLLQVLFVPESPVREAATRFDYLGGILLGGGLTAAIYAIGQGPGWGWTGGKTLAFLGGAVLALLLFVVVESRVEQPLLPLALIRRRRVWSVLLATAVAAAAVYAVGTVTQLLQLLPTIPTVSGGLGWSVTKSALVGSPLSVVVIVVAVFAGRLARRFDSRIMLGLGTVVAAAGFTVAAQYHHTVWQFILFGLIAGPGFGLIVSTMPIMIVESVSPQEQALANGSQWLTQGVFQLVFTQTIFTVMAHRGTVLQGTQFYHDSGFHNGFVAVVICLVAAALLVPLIPKADRAADADLEVQAA